MAKILKVEAINRVFMVASEFLRENRDPSEFKYCYYIDLERIINVDQKVKSVTMLNNETYTFGDSPEEVNAWNKIINYIKSNLL